MKTLRIDAEVECYPTWIVDEDGGLNNVDPTTLGLQENTVADLQAWDRLLQDAYNRTVPQDSNWPEGEAPEVFRNRGRELTEQVRRQVGNAIHVVYRPLYSSSSE